MSLGDQLLSSLRSTIFFCFLCPCIRVVLIRFNPLLYILPVTVEILHISLLPTGNLLNASNRANRGCYESKEASVMNESRDNTEEETYLFLFALWELPVCFCFLSMPPQAHFTPNVTIHSRPSS